MSKVFEFDKTSISEQFGYNLMEDFNISWITSRTADFYRMMFSTFADMLKIAQNKNYSRIGFYFKDNKGNFKFGSILNYQKPEEDEEDPTIENNGNWYLEFTFDAEDMTDIDYEIDNHSDAFARTSANNAMQILSGQFRSLQIANDMMVTAIDTLKKFLDANASEEEEVELLLKSVFKASVIVEGGEKIMSIVPGEFIKQLIKNDAAL